jgi:hypothetical protein
MPAKWDYPSYIFWYRKFVCFTCRKRSGKGTKVSINRNAIYSWIYCSNCMKPMISVGPYFKAPKKKDKDKWKKLESNWKYKYTLQERIFHLRWLYDWHKNDLVFRKKEIMSEIKDIDRIKKTINQIHLDTFFNSKYKYIEQLSSKIKQQEKFIFNLETSIQKFLNRDKQLREYRICTK